MSGRNERPAVARRRRAITPAVAGLLAVASAFPAVATAQQAVPITLDMRLIAPAAEPDAIPLGTGSVPAMPPESWFADRDQRVVRNVSRATLTPVLPRPGTETGAAVIIAPGGGFVQLSMDNEGWSVAHWLADHGIAAFVLKYRLRPTSASLRDFERFIAARIAEAQASKLDLTTPPTAAVDAVAALRLVRGRAKDWHVDPARVGLLGFSAGAMTTLATVHTVSHEDMPAFIGSIYGPMQQIDVPADAPPMFVALAADDPLFGAGGFGLVEGWHRAGKQVALHYFSKGGHGFGLGASGTDTFGWIDSFWVWLDAQGFLKKVQ